MKRYLANTYGLVDCKLTTCGALHRRKKGDGLWKIIVDCNSTIKLVPSTTLASNSNLQVATAKSCCYSKQFDIVPNITLLALILLPN